MSAEAVVFDVLCDDTRGYQIHFTLKLAFSSPNVPEFVMLYDQAALFRFEDLLANILNLDIQATRPQGHNTSSILCF